MMQKDEIEFGDQVIYKEILMAQFMLDGGHRVYKSTSCTSIPQ